MTHYYLYIEAGATVDTTSRFYKVAVGTSKQAQKDYLFLVAHAVDNGHFFEIWSTQVDAFLEKCWSLSQLDRSSVVPTTARDLVRAFKTNTRPTLSSQTLINRHRMMNALNIAYRIQSNLNREKGHICQR